MDATDEDVKRGLSHLDKEDYEHAFKILLPCANNGNLEAQASIGVMYQLGLGVERNVKRGGQV